jgi:drug/metabolite transporter (DMT)-like permease
MNSSPPQDNHRLATLPGFGVFAYDAIYPLVGAVGLAGYLTLTRAVSRHDDPRVTAFFGPLVAFILFSTAMPAKWVAPKSATHLALFAAIGLLAAGAQVLQTLAYRHGSTHRIAPYSYASLVVSIVVGWLVFRAAPTPGRSWAWGSLPPRAWRWF